MSQADSEKVHGRKLKRLSHCLGTAMSTLSFRDTVTAQRNIATVSQLEVAHAQHLPIIATILSAMQNQSHHRSRMCPQVNSWIS